MDQTKIKCFLALARTLNFTRAAEQVFLTQQAVSKAISSMENELQLQLFERNTRTVRLTSEGERLYEFFDRTDREFEQTVAELKRQQRPYTLHVGYQNYISFYDKLRQAKNSLQQRWYREQPFRPLTERLLLFFREEDHYGYGKKLRSVFSRIKMV